MPGSSTRDAEAELVEGALEHRPVAVGIVQDQGAEAAEALDRGGGLI